MEVESKYVVRESGAFSELLTLENLGRYRLEAMIATPVYDTYFDTQSGDLLNQGFVLRTREQGENVQVTLKSTGGVEGPLHRRVEIEADVDQPLDDESRLDLPEGPLKDTLDGLIGDDPLVQLLQFRQYRSPRVVFDGDRLVGVMSLDVIATETEIGPDISHQVEFELAGEGQDADIFALDPILKERGLEPTNRSKFERGMALLQRNPDTPLLILPKEQAELRRYQEAGSPLLRRRARVVLLSARGLGPGAVANKVGLSLRRVQHWIDAFRRDRMSIFDGDTSALDVVPSDAVEPRFRVLEIVSEEQEVPGLFPVGILPEPVPERAGSIVRKAPPIQPDFDDEPPPSVIVDSGSDGDDGVPRGMRDESIEVERHGVESVSPLPTGDGANGASPTFNQPTDVVVETAAPVIGELTIPQTQVVQETAHERVDISETNGSSHIVSELEDMDVSNPPAETIPLPNRPVLQSSETVLSAAEQVLRYQYAWYVDAANRAMEMEGEPRSIRRLLIAVHRLRIALQLFGDYLPKRPLLRLHQGLRGMAHPLDVLGDLDFSIAHVESSLQERNVAGFKVVLKELAGERRAARKAVHVRLNAATHTHWRLRFERLLDRLAVQVESGVDVDDFTPKEPDNYLSQYIELPQRTRLQHMLGSAVWQRYEGLRAFDSTVEKPSDDLLHPLGVACAAMQYVLALTSGCAEAPVREVTQPMALLESQLSVLHHARLTADHLEAFSDVEAAAKLRDQLRTVQVDMISEARKLWTELIDPVYRRALARVVASI